MNRKTPGILAITIIFIATLFFSCLKKSNNNTTTPVNYINISQLFTSLRTPSQLIKVWAGRDTMIFGAESTMLHFYPNSFRDVNNNILTNQWIYLELAEIYSAYDMISNHINTTSGDTILQSGGEINLTATTVAGQTVYIKPYGIGFKESAPNSQEMQLYYGNNNNPDSSKGWIQSNISALGTTAFGTVSDTFWLSRDSISGYDTFPIHYPLAGDMYIFDSCTNVGFTNCDFFWLNGSDTTATTNISIITPDTSYNSTNTEIFLYFPRYKTNILVNIYNDTTHTFSLLEGYRGVPIGYPYECIVVTAKNGNYYFYQTSGNITKGMSLNANMVQTTYSNIQTQLKGM